MNKIIPVIVVLINKVILTVMFWLFTLGLIYFLFTAQWYQYPIAYIGMWFVSNVIFGLTYHRWIAHNHWTPPRYAEIMLTVMGCGALVGNPIHYAEWHRTHHKHSDTELDPHSPKYKNFFRMTFLNHLNTFDSTGINVNDRWKDPFFRFLVFTDGFIAIALATLIYCLLPFSWFLALWVAPIASGFLCHLVAANWFAHKNGELRDIPLNWIWVFGEWPHKSHHDNPRVFQTKNDPAAWIIKKLGWYNE
jgi:stearoyl-CoA desaturase (delta-9 desaturase)